MASAVREERAVVVLTVFRVRVLDHALVYLLIIAGLEQVAYPLSS